MSEIQNFLAVTNAPTLEYLAQNYFTPGPSIDPDEIRSDSVDFSIQPIIENPSGSDAIYSADYVDTDTLAMAIGNFDTPATGGVFSLQIGAVSDAGLLNLPYNITASALQTALNIAITSEGATPLCTVSLVTAGVYQITAATNGTIATGLFQVTNYAALYPTSTAVFSEGTLGTASSPYVLLLVIAQAPMCYAEATVELPSADIDVTVVQAGVADTANKIQNIQFSAGTYAGSATIAATANSVTTTCGTITPLMTASQIGVVLANHPEINYLEADGTENNIAVTQVETGWNVEFINDLGDDDSNELTSPNSNVIGPQGKSGQIAYNTFNLWLYSLTQAGDSFQLTRQIQRTRVSGEVKTIYSAPVTIKKSMINAATTVPTPLPSYYTAPQTDTLLALKMDKDFGNVDGILDIAHGGTNADTALDAQVSLGRKTATKLSDTTRSLTTTPTADPDLVIAVEANKTYDFDLWCPMLAASDTPDWKGGMTFPTSPAQAIWQYSTMGNTVIAANFGLTGNNTTQTSDLFSGLIIFVIIRGTLINGSSAGNISYLWSQNVSSADTLKAVKGGRLTVTERT